MNLREDMDKVADAVAKKAAENDTSLQEKMDALKVLTAYYVATQKLDKKGGDDENEQGTFEHFTAAIEGIGQDKQNGREKISGRRGDA